ncbi:MAG: fimbrillin family protein [Duncaniella sp.]|uniref:fimbrillin family protein n=1 Tax=Duncaniella sp. TaxID=2518496 RepID=UPI0023BB3D54|nr:fimbrillin family protein [Duncaniella sp.]MDE6089169.1 fimbrillin family protein [Duncaniella sp.]
MKSFICIPYSFMAATALCAVAACSSSDEPLSPSPQEERLISFDAETASFITQSRAADVTTTENIPEFRIWAYDYSLYSYVMNGVKVVRTGINSWSYSPAVDWTGNPMCFTAVSPASIDINTNPWWLDMLQYQNGGEEDLVVCRVTNIRQTSGRLRLHFYHALSMVGVTIHSSLPSGSVRVKSATIVNVSNVGQFRYPSEGFNSSTTPEQVSECWDIYGQSTRIPVFLSDNGTPILDSPLEADNQGYNFFIPSRLGVFDFDAYFNSSYLEIDYRIENPDGSTAWPDSSTDYRLLSRDNPGYGQIRLGLGDKLPDNRWLSGKRYRYSVNLSGPAEVPPGAASEKSRSTSDGNSMDVDVSDL